MMVNRPFGDFIHMNIDNVHKHGLLKSGNNTFEARENCTLYVTIGHLLLADMYNSRGFRHKKDE